MSEIPAISRVTDKGEFRVFKKSQYTSDGWEPFLPRNPLDGTPFEGIAVAFEKRRQRLDAVRTSDVGLQNLNEDVLKSLPRRTARRLAQEGIAADKTGLGAMVFGVEVIDEDGIVSQEPPDYEPTDVQLKRFLRSEAKRLADHSQRLEEQVRRAVVSTHKIRGGADRDDAEEEQEYQQAMRALDRVHSLPMIICLTLGVTGSGAVHFTTPDRQTQESAVNELKMVLAEPLNITASVIGFTSIVSTTVGTLTESASLDIQLAIADAEIAKGLVHQVVTIIQEGTVSNNLTRRGLSIVQAELKKGPAMFPYHTDGDFVQRNFGASAARLNKEVEEWSERVQREQDLEKENLRRKMASARLASSRQPSVVQGGVASDAGTAHEPDRTGNIGSELTQGGKKEEEEEDEEKKAVVLKEAKRRRQKNKLFKIGKGDTLEMSGGDKEDSVVAPENSRKWGRLGGTHGFNLRMRPASSMALMTRDYQHRQASFATNTDWQIMVQEEKQRAHSSMGRMTSEQWQNRTDPRPPAERSASTLLGNSQEGWQSHTPSLDEEAVAKLKGYFGNVLARRVTPQTGMARKDTQLLTKQAKREMVDASVARVAAKDGEDHKLRMFERDAEQDNALHFDPWRLSNAAYSQAGEEAAKASRERVVDVKKGPSGWEVEGNSDSYYRPPSPPKAKVQEQTRPRWNQAKKVLDVLSIRVRGPRAADLEPLSLEKGDAHAAAFSAMHGVGTLPGVRRPEDRGFQRPTSPQWGVDPLVRERPESGGRIGTYVQASPNGSPPIPEASPTPGGWMVGGKGNREGWTGPTFSQERTDPSLEGWEEAESPTNKIQAHGGQGAVRADSPISRQTDSPTSIGNKMGTKKELLRGDTKGGSKKKMGKRQSQKGTPQDRKNLQTHKQLEQINLETNKTPIFSNQALRINMLMEAAEWVPFKALSCVICSGTEEINVSSLKQDVLSMLDPNALGDRQRIQCIYCKGIPTDLQRQVPPARFAVVVPQEVWNARGHKSKDPRQVQTVSVKDLLDKYSSGNADAARRVATTLIAGVAVDVPSATAFVCLNDATIVHMDMASGHELARLSAGGADAATRINVHCVCKVNNKLYLGTDEYIQEVDAPPGRDLHRKFVGHSASVLCLAVTHDKLSIVSGGADGITLVWDLDKGAIQRTIINYSSIFPAELAHFCADKPNDRPGFAFRHHRGPVSTVTAIQGAIITGSWDGTVCVAKLTHYREWWADERAGELMRVVLKENALNLKMKNDEKDMPVNTRKGHTRHKHQLEKDVKDLDKEREMMIAFLQTSDHRMRTNRAKASTFLNQGVEHAGRVTCVFCARREGARDLALFVGYMDGHVRQWDMRTATVTRTFMRGHKPDAVMSLTVGKGRLYTGYSSGKIKIWDTMPPPIDAEHPEKVQAKEVTKTQKNMIDVEGHLDGVLGMALCENLLMSHSEDKSVRIWDLRACDPAMELVPISKEKALAPGGALFAIGETNRTPQDRSPRDGRRRSSAAFGREESFDFHRSKSDESLLSQISSSSDETYRKGDEREPRRGDEPKKEKKERVRTIDLTPPEEDENESEQTTPTNLASSKAGTNSVKTTGRSPDRGADRHFISDEESGEGFNSGEVTPLDQAEVLLTEEEAKALELWDLSRNIQSMAESLKYSSQGATEFVTRWNVRKPLRPTATRAQRSFIVPPPENPPSSV